MTKLLAAAILAGAVFAPFGFASAATPHRPSAAVPKLVYSTSWKNGTLGWRPAGPVSPWQVKRGVLHCRCSIAQADNAFVAPYQTDHIANYAVVARIRFGAWSSGYAYQAFGVFARSSLSPWTDGTGVYAGYDHYSTGNGAAVWPHSVLHNVQNPFATADFTPGNGWHDLQLRVVGNQISLSVDGQIVVRAVTKISASRHSVGLFASSAAVSVKWFRVYAL